MRAINDRGLSLIIAFESFRAAPYQDDGGTWTIGYGHTRQVTERTPPVTEAEAEALLKEDLLTAEVAVCGLVTAPLTRNQYAALVSLVYNTGPAPLTRMLGVRLNRQDYAGAADEFLRWRISGGIVSDGLVRRRTAERALFLAPDDGE